MKRGGRGYKAAGGASFCHFCGNQLQAKAGGGLHFATLLTPGDRLPVRVHKDICRTQALADGYTEQKEQR